MDVLDVEPDTDEPDDVSSLESNKKHGDMNIMSDVVLTGDKVLTL